jgi:hypothetical protein
MTNFNFGDIVVVHDDQIGVVVKSWSDNTYEVYVRCHNSIRTYYVDDIQKYIYSKELTEEEVEHYK